MMTSAVITGLISGVRKAGGGVMGIPKELLEGLCEIYPEGRGGNEGHSFTSRLPIDDPRTKAILQLLERKGMRPWQGRGERLIESEYTYRLQRVYNDLDFDACEYLEFESRYDPDFIVPGEVRIRGRTIAMMKKPGTFAISKLGIDSSTYVVIQRAKEVLEAAYLKGLKFLPVEKAYESVDYDLYDEEDTWWELESDFELPPVSPIVTLVTRDGQPFRGDFAQGCHRTEGVYTLPELHYRRADLERFGPFDAARTHEHFHARGPAPRSRAFVVSHRFYEVCKVHNIRTRFVPVRIDD